MIYQLHIASDIKPEPSDHEISAALILSEYFQTDITFIKRSHMHTADFFRALAAVEPLSSVTAVLGAWFPVASFSAAEASGTVGTLELSSLVPGLSSLASCFPPFSFHVVAMEGEGTDVAFLIGLLLL